MSEASHLILKHFPGELKQQIAAKKVKFLTTTTTSRQRQKNPVGVSALPTGKFLRVWKVFERIYTKDPKIKSKDCIGLESFQTVWKVSGQSGKFPDILESFRTV